MRYLHLFLFLLFLSCQPIEFKNIHQKNMSIVDNIAVLTTNRGEIHIQFLTHKAPNTVLRIKELINNDFYNGIQFHRVISNFVIQAGDPTGTGAGGSGKKLDAEFNDELHVKGTVAMARLGDDINSADSQFYIALSTLPHLDKNYTVFGKVVKGIEILEMIQQGDKIISFKLNK